MYDHKVLYLWARKLITVCSATDCGQQCRGNTLNLRVRTDAMTSVTRTRQDGIKNGRIGWTNELSLQYSSRRGS